MSNDFAPDYVDVAERLRLLRAKYEDASLQGSYELREVNGTLHVIYRAECFRRPDDQRPGVGYAWEQVPGRTPYTRGSELMNAETSAWGRAIVATLAADTKRVASSEEMRRSSDADIYATSADLAKIGAALKTIRDIEQRALINKQINEVWGSADQLLASDVNDVLAHIAPWTSEGEVEVRGSSETSPSEPDGLDAPFTVPKNEDGTDAPSLLANGAYKPQDNASLAGNVTNIRADADVI